jgi:hypothetical protein
LGGHAKEVGPGRLPRQRAGGRPAAGDLGESAPGAEKAVAMFGVVPKVVIDAGGTAGFLNLEEQEPNIIYKFHLTNIVLYVELKKSHGRKKGLSAINSCCFHKSLLISQIVSRSWREKEV